MATDPRDTSKDATAEPPAEAFDLKLLNPVLSEFKGQKGAVIPLLQRAQDIYGYLPKEVMLHLSKRTGFPLSRLYGVATFYSQFRLTRRGRHLVRVCDGTACHVRGAAKNLEAVEKQVGLAAGETSPDFRYTLEIVYCLGSCGLAPVAVVDEKVHGRLTPDVMVNTVTELA
jgi:NADH-quinone oxidoreductase subunit E